MRVEKVYGHYFGLWDDEVSGQRKGVSHSLKAPTLSGELEPSPGTVHSGAHPPQSLQECSSHLVSLSAGPGDLIRGDLSAHHREMELDDL